jgi:predicted regulator of Ras-like GTPase activity (Roadblock/LC7/MglB family)
VGNILYGLPCVAKVSKAQSYAVSLRRPDDFFNLRSASMSTYLEKLANLNSSIDGVIASCFVGYDGLIIERIGGSNGLDVEFICATFTSVVNSLKNQENEVIELMATFQKDVVLIRVMEDGFICIVMSQDGNIGRAKLESKKLGKKFME